LPSFIFFPLRTDCEKKDDEKHDLVFPSGLLLVLFLRAHPTLGDLCSRERWAVRQASEQLGDRPEKESVILLLFLQTELSSRRQPECNGEWEKEEEEEEEEEEKEEEEKEKEKEEDAEYAEDAREGGRLK
jgi:hypothetical protein